MDRNEYNKIVDCVRGKVQQKGMVGFLQRFYCLNMVNDMIEADSEVRDEWAGVMKKELADMYSSLDSKYSSVDVPVVTIALLDSCFPEFLNNEPISYNREQRQAALTMISTSKHYQEATSLLKGEVMSSLLEDKSVRRSVEVPVIGDLSKGVVYTFKRPIEQCR